MRKIVACIGFLMMVCARVQSFELFDLSTSLRNLSVSADSLCLPILTRTLAKPTVVAYQCHDITLRIIIADIFNVPADAIVNAANAGCLGGGGIDGYISKMGGRALLQARQKLPVTDGVRCPVFQARITRSGDITRRFKIPFVVHAVGPVCSTGNMTNKQKNDLAATYVNSLKRIAAFNKNPKDPRFPEFGLINMAGLTDHAIKRINFPAISTGIFGCTTDQSARSVINSIVDLLDRELPQGIKEINFVFYNPADQQKAFDDFNEYKKALDGCISTKAVRRAEHMKNESPDSAQGCILF